MRRFYGEACGVDEASGAYEVDESGEACETTEARGVCEADETSEVGASKFERIETRSIV